MATNVADGASTATVRSGSVNPAFLDRTIDGEDPSHIVSANFMQPTLSDLEKTLVTTRVELARRYAHANELNKVVGDPSPGVGIVAAGATYLDIRQALTMLGITEETLASSGVRLLKLGMVSPLEPKSSTSSPLASMSSSRRSAPSSSSESRTCCTAQRTPRWSSAGGRRTETSCSGRMPTSPHGHGQGRRPTDPRAPDVPSARVWLDPRGSRRPRINLLPLADRTPYFCSGCPHNRSTETPDSSLVGAGIGC
ncbi:oxidoreductase [Rhodococcus opacus]|uniref:Putative oxidoreductase n=1 Tax=Rhodococcus opacus (strain B4) TaxID=632772 RepID=C1B664_RHOOB|nr:oxidoreductase [Rhodococcus opacus]BAH55475.1 putative oxidoreductase [Rhodococcus opacus B4]